MPLPEVTRPELVSAASKKKITQLERFVERIDSRRRKRENLSRGYSRIRLAVAVSGFVSAYFAYQSLSEAATWGVIAGFTAVFFIVAHFHNRVIQSIRKHHYYSRIKSTQIARIKRDWNALPETPLDESPPDHPFGSDLNLVGPRSLHHLIDTAFTKEGSDRLREWLTRTTPDPEKTRLQRGLVQELVPLSRFRDRISLLSALVTLEPNERWEGGVLLRWLKSHLDTGRIRIVLGVLGALAVITPVLLVLNLTSDLANWWVLTLMAYISIYLLNIRLYGHLFGEAEHLYYQLNRFRPVLIFLEKYGFRAGSRLESLASPFQEHDRPPSSYLRTAMWLSVAAGTSKNDVLRVVLNLLLPWELFFSLMLDRYKKTLIVRLPLWLDALQQLEAASSLASFADLNPTYTFPETVERPSGAGAEPETASIFTAQNLGHPLLPDDTNIRNDFEVSSVGHMALVTGSNMSGKSTFLRTLGTNLALAFAGGPVVATGMRTIHFRLFTCINVSDSVNDGISYFYAEVKRLKKLLDELMTEHTYPLFFLIDEIFRGTNNRERYVGSRALLLSLCKADGTGAISTHDLELVNLEAEAGTIHNYHFREHIENGKMVFDYTLRPGPCPTTNALKIMKLEGLPVEEAPQDMTQRGTD